MLPLLLTVLDDLFQAADADRTKRAVASRLEWTSETLFAHGKAYQGANPPAPLLAKDLDWRFEPTYSVNALFAYGWEGSRKQQESWLDEEIADRGIEWFREFSRWYKRSPEEEPVVLVEDVHGQLEGIWDGWHRGAVAISAGMKSLPAVVGKRRWPTTVKGRQDLAAKHYGVTDDPQKAAFLMSNGLWLDFSEGSDTRSQDHRNITWFVPEEERAKLPDDRTAVMNHWMNTTEAIRVSIGRDGYAMIDLPDGAEATVAVLKDPMTVGRYARFGTEFDLNWRGRNWGDLSLRELAAELRRIREEAQKELGTTPPPR